MGRGRVGVCGLGCVAGVLWASAGLAGAQAPLRAPAAEVLPGAVPLDELPAPVRERVRQVVQQPTLCTHGPAEVFVCQPATYYWLLDHHDRAAAAWRRLGARCVEISDRGGGRFGWSDGQGSDVHWDTVHRGPGLRVWYAEGVVRAGLLLPAVPVRAVVVLRHAAGHDEDGRPLLGHQLSLFVHADSRAATLAKRLLGASVPRLAEQYVLQMEQFFSSLARYLYRYPDQAEPLLSDAVRLAPGATPARP
jgi:hypothetical protein